MNARMLGRLFAVLLFVCVGIIVLISWAASRTPTPAGPSVDLGPTPTFEQDWAQSGIGGGSPEQIVRAGERWVWRRVGEDGRLEYLIEADRLDPLDRGRFALTAPVAWIYPRDGGRIRIRAANGQFVWPRGGEPESGDLTGGVTIDQFDADTERPQMTMRSDSLTFERTLGQLETPDEVSIEGPGMSFVGRGLTVRISEYTEPGTNLRRHRLNLVRIDEGREIRIDPSQHESRADRSDDDGSSDRSSPGSLAEFGEAGAVIDYYRAIFTGNVSLARAGQRLTAERAEIFAATVDGSIPSDAIRPIRFQERSQSSRSESSSEDAGSAEADALFVGAGTEAYENEEVVLTWSGPFELRPVQSKPDELGDDALAVRFSSPGTSIVMLEDTDAGLRARGASLRYAMSSALFDLSGVAGEVGVNITLEDRAELVAGRVLLDLEHSPLGRVSVMSPGVMREFSASRDGSETPSEVQWAGRADVVFDLVRGSEQGASVQLREINVADGVRANAPGLGVRSEFIRAEFAETDRGSVLSGIKATGSVDAMVTERGRLRAEEVEGFFDVDASPDRPVLRSAMARGGVRAEDDRRWIEADRIRTRFAPPETPDSDPELVWVEAVTGVRAFDGHGLTLGAETLRADLVLSSAELMGTPVRIRQQRDDGLYTLSGHSMTMADTTSKVERGEMAQSALERRLVVFGAGEATFEATPGRGSQERATLTWSDALEYDGIEGWVEIDGDIRAEHHPSPLEVQTGTGSSARVQLVAYAEQRDHPNPDTGAPMTVLRVTLDGSESTPAEALVRRYSASSEGTERAYEGLIALRSARIDADAVKQTLATPGPGLLVLEDRRLAEDGGNERGGIEAGDIRGTSVFEWAERMIFDRRSGEAEMRRNVKIRHLHPESRTPTLLLCEFVQAYFTPLGSGQENERPELHRILAQQAVYLWHQNLQMIADAIDYRAEREQITVEATDGNRVTVHNTETGQHFTADRLIVDRGTGEWRAIGGTGGGVISGNTIRDRRE